MMLPTPLATGGFPPRLGPTSLGAGAGEPWVRISRSLEMSSNLTAGEERGTAVSSQSQPHWTGLCRLPIRPWAEVEGAWVRGGERWPGGGGGGEGGSDSQREAVRGGDARIVQRWLPAKARGLLLPGGGNSGWGEGVGGGPGGVVRRGLGSLVGLARVAMSVVRGEAGSKVF